MAIDPVTVATVAQAGFQLYSLSRSSGSGVGRLLALETEMLRQISEQIGVLNTKIDLIYADVNALKKLVERLPTENALTLIRVVMSGYFGTARRIFGTRTRYLAEVGQEYARARVREEAGDLAFAISNACSSLMAEGNVAACPTVCTAWYIELFLRVTCMQYDEKRIIEMADAYDATLGGWLSDAIEPFLAAKGAALAAEHDAIRQSERYRDHKCYHSVRLTNKFFSRGGGGPHGGGGVEWTVHTLHAARDHLTAKPSPVGEALATYRAELAVLSLFGFEASTVYDKVAPYVWTKKTEIVQHDEKGQDSVPTSLVRLKEQMMNKACPAVDFGPRFAEKENARGASVEEIFAKTVVYAHFLVTCRETQRRVREVLARAARPTGSL